MIFLYILGGLIVFVVVFYLILRALVIIKDPEYELPDIINLERVDKGNNFFTCGNNWLNKNKYGLWEMYVEGDPLERGIAAGKLSKELIQEQEEIFIGQLKEFIPSDGYLKFLRIVIAWFNRHIEKHVDEEYRKEIFGISKFAPEEFRTIAENYQRYLNLHAAHDIGHILHEMHLTGCTAFAAWGDKTANSDLVVGRNFDFYVGENFARNKMMNFYNPSTGHKFVFLGWGGMIGAVSGMNTAGLTLTINGARSKRPGNAKTPTSILGREILQYASTINEAYEIAKKRDLFVSESYLISSVKDNKAAVIEKTPHKTALREVDHNFISLTNHFHTEAFKDDKQNNEQIRKSDSLYRFERINELINKNEGLNPEKVAEILRNWKGKDEVIIGLGNEKAINQFICHHSIIFQPADQKVWISTDPYQIGEYVCYDLKEVFSKYPGLKEKSEIYIESENIPEDNFLGTKEYQDFIKFRQNISPMANEQSLANKDLDKKTLDELIDSNPEFYQVYVIAADYYLNKKQYSHAHYYYKFALTKEVANLWEVTRIEKRIEKCLRKGGKKALEEPILTNLVTPVPDKSIYNQKFKENKCCVLIPTYNNRNTIEKVINSVLEYTNQIIIVNDGSTDDTPEILKKFPNLDITGYEKNKGKGFALRTGFKHARKRGFDYAITIDSDGQHLAQDLPVFIERMNKVPNSIIVGARNMDQDSVPGKSSFGHRFSNFWFWFNTGIRLPDTQSGYRLYPLEPLKKMRFFTTKYEFEIEVIVRASWRNVNITSVPVKVLYEDDRVTHFRPFKDFGRVSVLNTVLVLIALLYAKPFKFIKDIKKKNLREFWDHYIINSKESNLRISAAVMLGLFIGVAPIWGGQIAAGIGLAHFFRLNKVITVVVSHISIPPMIPIILWASYAIGGLALGAAVEQPPPDLNIEGITENIYNYISGENYAGYLFRYLIGSVILGILLSVVFGLITYVSLTLFRKRKVA